MEVPLCITGTLFISRVTLYPPRLILSTGNVVVIEEPVARIRRYAAVPAVVTTTLAVCVAPDVIHNGVVNHNRSLGFLTH
jgi:hypothetical protein